MTTKLNDFISKPKDLWSAVMRDGVAAEQEFKSLWAKVEETPLTQDEAVSCLNALAVYTHKRIVEHDENLAGYYPTKQYTKNQLASRTQLWWMDHFTAGISQWGTLKWFSSAKIKNDQGESVYPGASTHFILDYHDDPMYIIPLNHGAWHCPARNSDSIGIEHVNAGPLHLDKETNQWHYWAGVLPQALVAELPPVILAQPFRDARAMQPFPKDQIIRSIKLKRVVLAALPGLFEPCHMTQHQDWQPGKKDMGPLWPFEDCTKAAFATDPLLEMSTIQMLGDFADGMGTPWKASRDLVHPDESKNPHNVNTPDGEPVWETKDIQERLIDLGIVVLPDGVYGAKTADAVKEFQRMWNKRNPRDMLKVDGIAGPETCKKLATFKP